jgi:predicted nucleic acid-binding protein
VAAFFFDTSAVLKRYVQETGTPGVQAMAASAAGHSLIVVRITLAETIAAITRRERNSSISSQGAATAHAGFQLDFARQYIIVEVSAGPVAQAAMLARSYAVQLAAALEIHAADPSLTLLSADLEIIAAATAAGLMDVVTASPAQPT